MELHVAAVQMQCVNFALRDNLECAGRAIQAAAAEGAMLILLPEFFHIGYSYDARLRHFVEPVGGRTTEWLVRWSRRTGAYIGGCIAEQEDHLTYDTFLLAAPSGELHVYRKRHPAFFENLYFARGIEEGIFDTPIGRVGVMICWDMVQPNLAEAMAGRVDWLIISAAWPDMRTGNWPLPFFPRWMAKQAKNRPRQLAAQLKVPTLYSNMTGAFCTRVPWLKVNYRCPFAGRSAIVDGRGATISSSKLEETVVHAVVGNGSRIQPIAA